MNSAIIIVIITVLFIVFGGGVGLFLYFKLKPKPVQWKATIFEATNERLPVSFKDNKKFYDYGDLYGLTQIGEDIVEKIQTKDGKTHYWLKNAKREVMQINTDIILNKHTRNIIIVKHDEEYLLAKAAINKDNIFHVETLPHDIKNLMRSEITLREQQYKDTLNGWAAVAPYIMGAIAFFSIVMIVFLVGKFGVDIYNARAEQENFMADRGEAIAKIMQDSVYIAKKYADGLETPEEKSARIKAEQTVKNDSKPPTIPTQ